MSAILRNNVKLSGSGEETLMFAHGYGCDQSMWRHVTPAFEKDYRLVLFDYVARDFLIPRRLIAIATARCTGTQRMLSKFSPNLTCPVFISLGIPSVL